MSDPAKHTPGPWLVKEGHLSMIHSADAEIAYDVENPADANLIAAAPELLAHLKNLLACWRAVGGNQPGWQAEEIAAAIAKAEGRAGE